MPKLMDDLRKSLEELARRGGISSNRAFAAWYAINFHDIDEDDALEAAEIDGGNDQGIDLVFFDNMNEEIVVLQAHYPENINKKTPKPKWDALVAAIPFFENTEELRVSGRDDLAEAIDSIKQANPDCGVSYGLLSMGLKSNEIERALSAQKRQNKNRDINYFYFSQEDLLQKYQSLLNNEEGIPEEDIKYEGGYFTDIGDYGEAYICSVSAKELIRLHEKYKDSLFAGNVRLYLGNRKGGINYQIINTANNNPGIFWALNNGITIVADTVEKKKSQFRVCRFSIVNGCQTTSCLARAESENAKVLLRIIAAKHNLKSEIVRYNNSQNSVKIWTVRAVDLIQEQLRNEFKKIKISYAPKQAGSKRKRSGNIIELDKVTQYLASSTQDYLVQAINNKSELFDQPYKEIFRKDITAPEVYLAWLIGELTDKQRQSFLQQLDPADESNNLALLGIASKYWIIYVTYKLLRKFSDLDSPKITLEKLSKIEMVNALKKYIDRAIDMYYETVLILYAKDTHGSVRSALRNVNFFKTADGLINGRIARNKKSLPNISSTAQSI